MSDDGASTRFFCHQCRDFVTILPSNLSCPQCEGTFLEEVNEQNENEFAPDEGHAVQEAFGNPNDIFSLLSLIVPNLYPPPLTNENESVTGDQHAAAEVQSQGAEGANASTGQSTSAVAPDGQDASRTPQNARLSGPHNARIRRVRLPGTGGVHSVVFDSDDMSNLSTPSNPDSMVTFGEDTLQRVLDGLFRAPAMNVLSFNGNPQDYAWGPGGLDAILTQMMDQLEGGGPPPCSDETIRLLPDVVVSEQHVTSERECSVCQEKFSRNEKVKCLPCSHMFHKECIEPWLRLHNACPVCRKSIPGNEQSPKVSNLAATSSGNTDDETDPDPAIFRNSNAYG